MDAINFTQKYSSLFNVKSVNPLAEVLYIKDQRFGVSQRGQCWHSRLACWIKDSACSLFSSLRKNTADETKAWNRLSKDLREDASIEESSKLLAQAKITKWQRNGVPLRKLHVRQILRQLDENLDPQTVGVSLKNLWLHRGTPDPGEQFGIMTEMNDLLPVDGDGVILDLADPTQEFLQKVVADSIEEPKTQDST